MREYRVVRVADIKVGDREIRPNDTELPDLVSDVRKRGLQVPVLVDPDLNLFDGLRRLQAFAPGDEIDVVVSDNYIDTLELLKLSNIGPFLKAWDMRRLWDFHVVTTAQRRHNHFVRKAEGNSKKQRGLAAASGDKYKTTSISRTLLAEVSGMPGATIQAGLYIYSRAYGLIEEHDPQILAMSKELVGKIDAGYNVYRARHEIRLAQLADRGSIVTESEQRKVLRSSASSARVLTQIFKDFASINSGITAEEAKEFYRALMQARTDFLVITKKLKERIAKG